MNGYSITRVASREFSARGIKTKTKEYVCMHQLDKTWIFKKKCSIQGAYIKLYQPREIAFWGVNKSRQSVAQSQSKHSHINLREMNKIGADRRYSRYITSCSDYLPPSHFKTSKVSASSHRRSLCSGTFRGTSVSTFLYTTAPCNVVWVLAAWFREWLAPPR